MKAPMENILQQILHNFVTQYPGPDEPAQIDLTVGTHDPNRPACPCLGAPEQPGSGLA